MPVTFVSTSSAAAPAACCCAGARLNIAACALHSPRAPSPSSPAITWADEGAPTQLQHISWDELRQRCMQVAACVAAKYQPGVGLCVWHAWQQLLCITALQHWHCSSKRGGRRACGATVLCCAGQSYTPTWLNGRTSPGRCSRTSQHATTLFFYSSHICNFFPAAAAAAGDALAIAMPLTVEAAVIYFGIVLAGCVVVSIADSFAASEVAVRLRIAGAVAVFTQVGT